MHGTWSDVIAEGGGPFNLRLVIEGAKYQFVEAIEQRGRCYGASLLPAPGAETWVTSGGTAVITTGQADPFGGTNAVSIGDDSGAAFESARPDQPAYVSGTPVAGELWLKRDASATSFPQIALGFDGVFNDAFSINHLTGATDTWLGSFESVSTEEVVDGWWRIRFRHAGAVAAAIAMRFYPAEGTAYPTRTVAATGTHTVYGPVLREWDGRRRVVGLLRDGMGFVESAYLAGAESSIAVNPVTIVETPEPDLNAATELFSKIPRTLTWLAASLGTADVSASTLDATDISVGDFVHLGTEVVRVDAISGTDLTEITRAQWGTTTQAHNVTSAETAETQQVTLLDGVGIWTKRRWWLYAHGPSELDSVDDGELVMRGVIAGEPEEQGGEWTISLDSRWALLDQEVAASVDVERKIRGIYYPAAAPYWMRVRQSTDTTAASTSSGASAATDTYVILSGFWETQQEFCDALAAKLNADPVVGTWATWDAQVHGDHWELFYTTPAVDPRYLQLGAGSHLDGTWFHRVTAVDDVGSDAIDGSVNVSIDTTADTVNASDRYLCRWTRTSEMWGLAESADPDNMRRVPRTTNLGGIDGLAADTDAQAALFPAGRQYLTSVIGLAVGDTMLLPQGDVGEDLPPVALTISSVSLATSSVDAYTGSTVDSPSGVVAAGTAAEAIAFTSARSYGDADGDDLAGFLDALLLDAPEGANDASTPWITSDDVASWTSVVAEASADLPYLARRRYTFSKGQRLEDVLKNECRLYGVFPYLDHDFKIALRRLTVETDAVASGLHVTGNRHIVDERRAEIRQGVDGHVNVIELARDYDPTDDKYKDQPIHVRSVAGIARAKARRVLEIRPKTRAVDAEPTPLDAARFTQPILALFGAPKLVHVTVDVPLTFWDVLVGDSVLLTDETAPHDGARGLHDPGQGLASTRAIVVGREWRLDDAAGTLTCLITGLDVAGYTPSARVASATGATTSWTLTVEASHYAPAGANDDSYFAVGDRVRLIEWDADSPTVVDGVIDSVDTSTHEIGVTLDASWAGLGGATYNLEYRSFVDMSAGDSDDQIAYAFIANDALRLDNTGALNRAARVFAP